MSARRLLALGALAPLGVAAALVLAPAVASAQEDSSSTEEEREEIIHEAETIAEQNGATHADVECIPTLVGGGSVNDCHEAPSPILPETSEIIWGSISFVILFVVLAKLAYPAIQKSMDARTDRIRSTIDDAERQRSEAQSILEQYQRQLADAKAESSRIIDEARQQADALKRDLQARAEAEAAEQRQRLADDIANQVAQAQSQLQAQVAELSIQLAERVVERSLDRDTNLQLVENLIRDLEAQGS
ncbi:MAG TPA: F0F1 ATP synthase subunit B [Acidimicrobiales bacterium]|jgi:F-type H+-transporting ATPase subunit b